MLRLSHFFYGILISSAAFDLEHVSLLKPVPFLVGPGQAENYVIMDTTTQLNKYILPGKLVRDWRKEE